jgi:hypothetical protein
MSDKNYNGCKLLAFLIASAATPALALQAAAPAPTANGPASAPISGPGNTPRSTGSGQAGSQPASAPARVRLKGVVIAITNNVQYRNSEEQPWVRATVGLQLDEQAELRTGLRSSVTFLIEPDQTITLDRLGVIRILQAYLDRGKVTTDLGLKYGRTRYDIKSADLEHESTIHSPGSALAIRGTNVTYEDQAPWVPSAFSDHGRAEFRNSRRQFLAFGGAKPTGISADKNSVAEYALGRTKADPRGKFAARTESEEQLNVALDSVGGADAQFNRSLQELAALFQPVFVGAPVNAPGPLQFDLTWSPESASLGLAVKDPRNQSVSAAHPMAGKPPDSAMLSSNFPGFQEIIYPESFPLGRYTVKVVDTGGSPATATVTVLQGQQFQQIKAFPIPAPPAATIIPGQTFTGMVTIRKTP